MAVLIQAKCKRCIELGFDPPNDVMEDSHYCSLHQSKAEIEDHFLAKLERDLSLFGQVKHRADMQTRLKIAEQQSEAERTNLAKTLDLREETAEKLAKADKERVKDTENMYARIMASPLVEFSHYGEEPVYLQIHGISWKITPGLNKVPSPFYDEYKHRDEWERLVKRQEKRLGISGDNPTLSTDEFAVELSKFQTPRAGGK